MFNIFKKKEMEIKKEGVETKIIPLDSVCEEINNLVYELGGSTVGIVEIPNENTTITIHTIAGAISSYTFSRTTLYINKVEVIINAGSRTLRPRWSDWVIESGKKEVYEDFIIKNLRQAMNDKIEKAKKDKYELIKNNIKRIGL